jgi:subtilisin family serine protease
MRNQYPLTKAAVLALVLIFLAMPLNDSRAADSIGGQVIIKMLPNKSVGGAISAINGTVTDTIQGANVFLIEYPDSLSQLWVISELSDNSDVVIVEPNHVLQVPELMQMSQSFPDQNSPAFLMGESPISYYGNPDYDAIKADSAHKIATGNNVVVAIIDNGVDFDHPLFSDAFKYHGYDFVDDDTVAAEEPGSFLGHGTFVTGIIVRIAPDCRIIPLRAFDEEGYANVFNVAAAIYRAIDDSARIINMSFSVDVDNAILSEAIETAFNAGISMAAAAGNGGINTTVYPADYRGVFAVSAIDSLELIAGFSNYGDMIDICAPGVNIYSSLTGDYEWGTWSGTSFSAPMVSATCALLLELEPNLDPIRMMEVIQNTADTDLQWGTVTPDDIYYGFGRVDALAAVIEFNKGDVDYSMEVDELDVFYLQDFLYQNGPAPVPLPEVGDLDCSGSVNLDDMIILINYLSNGGPAPIPCE